jgi:hypothetical protein
MAKRQKDKVYCVMFNSFDLAIICLKNIHLISIQKYSINKWHLSYTWYKAVVDFLYFTIKHDQIVSIYNIIIICIRKIVLGRVFELLVQ